MAVWASRYYPWAAAFPENEAGPRLADAVHGAAAAAAGTTVVAAGGGALVVVGVVSLMNLGATFVTLAAIISFYFISAAASTSRWPWPAAPCPGGGCC